MDNQKNYSFQPVGNEIICCHPVTEGNYAHQKLYYHRHDAYEIYLFIRGNANMYLEQTCYHMKPGDLVVISPSEMHRSTCLDDQVYERAFINVKKNVLDRLSTKHTNLFACFESHPLGQRNLTNLSEKQMEHFIELTGKLRYALKSDGYGQDILVDSYLSQILVFVNALYLNSNHSADNIMPQLIRSIMTFIEEHLNETITMEQLSEEFFLSGAYISRQFRKHTGLSLRQYILGQRIFLAKALLIEGKSVSEACYMSGFSDYANFIRSFKKSTGISPGRMKKSVQGTKP